MKWTENWGLTISKEKTVSTIFTSKRTGEAPPLIIAGSTIAYKSTVKFLGMQFDNRLTWGNHVNQTIAKFQKDLRLLRIISYDKIRADFITLKRIYISYFTKN